MTEFTPAQFRAMADVHHGSNHADKVAAMLRQAASDREDADRYRWLRMNYFRLPDGHLLAYSDDGAYLASIDILIDQARQESRHG